MLQENVDQFFALAQERLRIKERRDKGLPGPWTDDPQLRQWRFCNTYREDDRTTVWFREKIREPLAGDYDNLLFATTAFRWFNRIETGEKILPHLLGGWEKWDPNVIREILKGVTPVVTGAFIIKTPNGMNKLDGVLQCIENVRKDMVGHGLAYGIQQTPAPERTLEDVWRELCEYPYLGPFMAYQIVSDLRHTCWLDEAEDAYTWASLGPGSTRGCGWIESNEPDRYSLSSKSNCNVMRAIMRDIVEQANGHSFPRRWEMQTVQHWLCEYDKYRRAALGQEMKRKFS